MQIRDIPNIDVPIIDILERFNALGYKTRSSCCGMDYEGQGIKDHTNAHIIFISEFKNVECLKEVVEGYWIFEYLGERKWCLTRGCEHNWNEESERKRYQRGNARAWNILREALYELERRWK